MTSFRQYKHNWLIILLLSIHLPFESLCQQNWDWHDPVDLDFVDFGDNKLLLYNGIALGLIHLFSKEKSKITGSDHYDVFELEYYHEYRKAPLSTVFSIKKRKGWKWKKSIWLGYELGFFSIDDDKFKAGVGLSPFFSWNIVNVNQWRISFDNGIGPVYYFSPFPQEGTHFNFYTFYGLQFEYKAQNSSYSLGVRNTHISNAGIWGKEKNPSFDGVGMYLKFRY